MSVALSLAFLSVVCVALILRNRWLGDRVKLLEAAQPVIHKQGFEEGVAFARRRGPPPIEDRERAAYMLGVQHAVEATAETMGVRLHRPAVRKAGEHAGQAWDGMREPEQPKEAA